MATVQEYDDNTPLKKIKQEADQQNESDKTGPTTTKQNISPYVLNKDRAYKKIQDAANREKHIEFKFYPSCLVIDLSAAAYGPMCKAFKKFYEDSGYQVFRKETVDQEGITTEWKLSIKDPDNKKQCLGIAMYHTTSRILVNGSMYSTIFLSRHLDQINQSLPDSEEMVAINQDIKIQCAEGLKQMKNPRKSKTPQKENQPTETPIKRNIAEVPDSIPFQESQITEMVPKASDDGSNFSAFSPGTTLLKLSETPIPLTTSTDVDESGNQEEPTELIGCGSTNKPEVTSTATSPIKTPAKKASPSCGRGSMMKKDADVIQANYTFLIKELDPMIIADHLFEALIFDHEEHEKITSSKEGKIAGMRFVLQTLRNSGKSAFPKFIEVLRRTGYEHVADELIGIDPDA